MWGRVCDGGSVVVRRGYVLGEGVCGAVCGVTGVVRLWSFTLSDDQWRHGHVHLEWGCYGMKEKN